MATNGASARQWLAEHGSHKPLSEIERIRDAIADKLEVLTEDHPEQEGLLEALDVMDERIALGDSISSQGATVTATADSDHNNSEHYQLDSSPLVPDLAPTEELSPEEKQARFRNLLQSGRLPSKD